MTPNCIRYEISIVYTFSLNIAYHRINQALLGLYIFALEKRGNSRKSKCSSNQTQLKSKINVAKSLPLIQVRAATCELLCDSKEDSKTGTTDYLRYNCMRLYITQEMRTCKQFEGILCTASLLCM